MLDVLVIGGGINGAGIARDLALRSRLTGRDLRIGVVDKSQFGSGTSGKNSHLVHGGLRYLKTFDFALVREALRERSILMKIAPHLVQPLSFLLPFESRWDQAFYGAGLLLYDILAGKHQLQRHRHLPLSRLAALEPELNIGNFAAAAVFSDGQMHAARLVLENVWDALANGAIAANYVEVLGRSRGDDGTWQVSMRDRIAARDFEVRSRRIVDATGAWMHTDAVRLVRGSHLIFPRINKSSNAIAYFESGGRIVFFIPWGTGLAFTLAGTTDADHRSSPDDVHISDDEVKYLLGVTSHVFRSDSVPEPISSFSSLRPLVREEGRSATATSREHRIWADDEGVVRVTGGKYTTYRAMSEEAASLLVPDLGRTEASAEHPLCGNTPEAIRDLLNGSNEQVRAFVDGYGVQATAMLAEAPDDPALARIAYAARHEMTQRLRDLLFVSSTWGYERHWDFSALHDVSKKLGHHLGWDESAIQSEVRGVLENTAFPRH